MTYVGEKEKGRKLLGRANVLYKFQMSKWNYLLQFGVLRAPGLGPVEVLCIISVRSLLALIETDR